MENDHNNFVIEYSFQIKKNQVPHFHQYIELIYVLEGEILLQVENEEFEMKADDIIIINANKKHSYQAKMEVLLSCFRINYQKLSLLLNTSQILFWCNSIIDKNKAYDNLREIMKRIFNQYFEEIDQGRIYLSSKYYELLHIIVSNFMMKSDDQRFKNDKDMEEERVAEIYNYINANYDQQISLNDLSGKMYLSVPYLSKYIKKKFGQNFVDYVNSIRLFHAMDELLYTDKTIMRIAMENGFANTASFNAAFKKVYEMSPSEYRIKMKPQKMKEKITAEQKKEEAVAKKLSYFIENNFTSAPDQTDYMESSLIVNASEKKVLNKPWNKMINIGEASDLLRSDIQNHVLVLKEKLGFRYIRFWNIYSKELYINENNLHGKYNYEKLDKILDFLVDNELFPYIELGFKPQKLYRNVENPMVIKETQSKFEDKKSQKRFLNSFAVHIANRYGIEEIEQWYFEQWNDERWLIDHEQALFFEEFEHAYQALKKVSPNIKIGGPGIGIQFGRKNLSDLLEFWAKKECKPDFVSLYCYPYIVGTEGDRSYVKISTDRDFVKNQLSMAKELINMTKFAGIEVHVSEWNSTISNRSSLNDSCFKAAYTMKSIMDNIDNVDILGYWIGSDIFAEFYDSQILLNGACGLISKDGIKKPAFYAFDFMNKMGKSLLGIDQNSIITDKGHYNYAVACHNYRHLNYKYYLKNEDEISISKQFQVFEDNKELKLNYQIGGIKNGNYQITIYSVNQMNGSVQDEWAKMEYSEHLTKHEIEYLNRICTPRIFMKTCKVKDGKLNLETKLMAQEIQYIKIQYLYD
ncbi:GH39 family glycosyl hydrolase [Anaerosacchariphilus polymeriproducens]|uniref:Helix-turn-helix domain-containing protein n=1 Tax=Anaerosacchariphilus polymeriproducens TaxID=1812858 RepID=A0A371AWZ0_9FIRM|nr:helix-turn-helix domain-containing protein [Anaerosacchariphilus polymeriproducens]RDU24096.1 helix-turn-helix domain-containing protein [Anaerosacchariphilus polymeriproducens]